MARGASSRKPGCNVARIGCAVVIRLVASVAQGGQRRVIAVRVALGAGQCGMCSRQRERGRAVIE